MKEKAERGFTPISADSRRSLLDRTALFSGALYFLSEQSVRIRVTPRPSAIWLSGLRNEVPNAWHVARETRLLAWIAGRRVQALMQRRRPCHRARTPHHEQPDQRRAESTGDRTANRRVSATIRERGGAGNVRDDRSPRHRDPHG